VNLLLL